LDVQHKNTPWRDRMEDVLGHVVARVERRRIPTEPSIVNV
jgi:hypothetical protein